MWRFDWSWKIFSWRLFHDEENGSLRLSISSQLISSSTKSKSCDYQIIFQSDVEMDKITDQNASRFVPWVIDHYRLKFYNRNHIIWSILINDILGITCIEPFSEVFLSSILTSMAINWWFPEIPRLLFFFSNIFCWFWADLMLISAINVSLLDFI